LPAKGRVIYPPIHAHLLGFVHRSDYQAKLDGQQFDVNEADLDIACYYDPFVQDTFEQVCNIGALDLIITQGSGVDSPYCLTLQELMENFTPPLTLTTTIATR
jgi:hypothetical protein